MSDSQQMVNDSTRGSEQSGATYEILQSLIEYISGACSVHLTMLCLIRAGFPGVMTLAFLPGTDWNTG